MCRLLWKNLWERLICMAQNNKKLIIIGASGHGKVIADIAVACGYEIAGFLDDDINKKECYGCSVLGTSEDAEMYSECNFVIAIGNNSVRRKISKIHPNLHFISLIHPSAVISKSVKIGEGTVVMPQAVINADTVIGSHCIVNSASVIEHDCRIENYTHISPGAVLCGTVSIGENTWIGAGSTVINNVSICSDTVIGAGSTVIKNIEKSGVYIGTPAQEIV